MDDSQIPFDELSEAGKQARIEEFEGLVEYYNAPVDELVQQPIIESNNPPSILPALQHQTFAEGSGAFYGRRTDEDPQEPLRGRDTRATYDRARERSRSPVPVEQFERERSPRRHIRRSSFSPSPSREIHRRRSHSPMTDHRGGATRAPQRRYEYEDRTAQREQRLHNIQESSDQKRRVYVGNLSYDVDWFNLKDYMKQAGDVVHAEILKIPHNGMSKGCGIVEFASREDAQYAIENLSDTTLMGRQIYVREDREAEPRFGTGPPRGAHSGRGFRGGFAGGHGGSSGNRQLFVSNVPYNAGWQDVKDLFRQAATHGNIIRADINVTPDGRSKGTAIVAFDNVHDAQNAINTLNGYDWQGRQLEVREDRFANAGYGGGRGGYGSGYGSVRGYGGRGGFGRGAGFTGGYGNRGGYANTGYQGAGMGGQDAAPAAPNPFTDNATGNGEPSDTIFIRNLPWATTGSDLVDLFQTIGQVHQAEIQYEPGQAGRSRGTGVVKCESPQMAETAISRFSGYQYGGRPLGISYVQYLKPEDDPDVQGQEAMGMTQEQMM